MNKIYVNHPPKHRDSPDKDYDSLVNTQPRYHCWPLPYLLYLSSEDAKLGFRTEYLKNDIRECRYPGKPMRPDTTRRKALFRGTYQREKAVSIPQTFQFLHPATRASGRVFSCWWDRRRCTTSKVKTEQACVLA
jgi:hypothetical protein